MGTRVHNLAAELFKREKGPLGAQWARKRVVVDTRAALPIGPAYFDDSLHLTAAGSDRLGEVVHQAIRQWA